MKRFAALYRTRDATRKTKVKEGALVEYFLDAPAEDAAWALHYLLGKKGRRVVQSRFLRAWTAEASGLPEWLVEESYDAVGDLAETVSLLAPGPAETSVDLPLNEVVTERVQRLAELDEAGRKSVVLETFSSLGQLERMLYAKLITGGFRIGGVQGVSILSPGDNCQDGRCLHGPSA